MLCHHSGHRAFPPPAGAGVSTPYPLRGLSAAASAPTFPVLPGRSSAFLLYGRHIFPLLPSSGAGYSSFPSMWVGIIHAFLLYGRRIFLLLPQSGTGVILPFYVVGLAHAIVGPCRSSFHHIGYRPTQS